MDRVEHFTQNLGCETILSWRGIPQGEAEYFAIAVQNNARIEEAHLDADHVSIDQMKTAAVALSINTNIKKLVINGSRNLELLFDGLRRNKSIRSVFTMSYSSADLKALLKACTRITKLVLAGRRDGLSIRVCDLPAGIRELSLQNIAIQVEHFKGRGLEVLQLFNDKHVLSDTEGAAICKQLGPRLRILCLSQGGAALADLIRRCTRLEQLTTEEDNGDVVRAIRDSASLKSVSVGYGQNAALFLGALRQNIGIEEAYCRGAPAEIHGEIERILFQNMWKRAAAPEVMQWRLVNLRLGLVSKDVERVIGEILGRAPVSWEELRPKKKRRV